jgi:hypothetical protein
MPPLAPWLRHAPCQERVWHAFPVLSIQAPVKPPAGLPVGGPWLEIPGNKPRSGAFSCEDIVYGSQALSAPLPRLLLLPAVAMSYEEALHGS